LVNEAPAHTLRQQLDAEKQQFMVNLLRPEAGQAIEKFLNRKG